MITKEYAKAYKEVIEILKYLPEEDVVKIPQEKLDFYKERYDLAQLEKEKREFL